MCNIFIKSYNYGDIDIDFVNLMIEFYDFVNKFVFYMSKFVRLEDYDTCIIRIVMLCYIVINCMLFSYIFLLYDLNISRYLSI